MSGDEGDVALNRGQLKIPLSVYVSDDALMGLVLDADGIPELDPLPYDLITADATMVHFGKRRTGKSFSSRWLMYLMRDFFPRGLVLSETEEVNHFYGEFVPHKYIHNGFDEEIVQEFNDFQRSLKKDPQHEERLKRYPNYNRAFIVYDDVISDENQVRYSEGLRRQFILGRHIDTLVLFNTQYTKAIPPVMRENTDFAFMYQAMGKNSREELFDL